MSPEPRPRSVAEAHRWLNSGDAARSLAGVLYLYGSMAAYPRPHAVPEVPLVRSLFAADAAIRTCLYRDHHCGCDLPTCHAGYGDYDDGEKASREHCLACLRTTWGLI